MEKKYCDLKCDQLSFESSRNEKIVWYCFQFNKWIEEEKIKGVTDCMPLRCNECKNGL